MNSQPLALYTNVYREISSDLMPAAYPALASTSRMFYIDLVSISIFLSGLPSKLNLSMRKYYLIL